jgi:hypothetical protein
VVVVKFLVGCQHFWEKRGCSAMCLKSSHFFYFIISGGGANPYFHNPSGVVNIPSGGLTGRNGGVHGRLIFLVGGSQS